MNAQLKKGVLSLCVLSRLNQKDSYGYDIYQAIDKVLGISESTIYPILRKMEHGGYLETYLKASPEGPARKYFKITDKGRRQLDALSAEWEQFVGRIHQLI